MFFVKRKEAMTLLSMSQGLYVEVFVKVSADNSRKLGTCGPVKAH